MSVGWVVRRSVGWSVTCSFLNAENEHFSLYENHWSSLALTLLNVLSVLNVLNMLNVLYVLNLLYMLHVLTNMPMDAS